MVNQAFIFNKGKFYVRFPDGEKSMCMPKSIAKDYAKIFGGTVHRHKDFPTLLEKAKRWANMSDKCEGKE